MLKLASGLTGNQISRAHSTSRSAHFDIAVVSATGYAEAPGRPADPVNLLAEGLKTLNKDTALLHCAHFGETGVEPAAQPPRSVRQAILHKMIRRRFLAREKGDDTRQFHSTPDKVIYAAAKLVCVDDRLFNLPGGGELVRASVSTARRAGRTTALLCTDLQTAFDRRQEIIASFGGALDFVVGEPPAVLAMSGLRRIDSLIPRMTHVGTGLILHRVGYPSIFLRPAGGALEIGGDRISKEAFWAKFAPRVFGEFLQSGSATHQSSSERLAGA